ncbi:MAG TPA: complex I subunit 5 family protein [Phycisphaerae bacterium]|nr:complex I subunit 5 family protein [Phycisphaerae bacterium]
MAWLVPMPVAGPLLVAAVIAAVGGMFPRRLVDALATVTAGAVLVVCVVLAREAGAGHGAPLVYWFGGWRPGSVARAGAFPVGVSFVVDPLGASMASLVSLLMLAAMMFSWAWFKEVKVFFRTIMLIFLAAMCGLCLTGDLFNLFVWFELMTAAGVTLCGYKSQESSPLQGALNFAVPNTIGAFMTLIGIGLVYAYTGSLNMAAAGETLRAHPPGSLALMALLLVSAGFLVKGALAPFHFWLADAHAVAPTPVSVLFSGVMVELGLFAIWRVYWGVFSGIPDAPEHAVRVLLLLVGTLTAVWGGLMCYGQHHFKRLLAFSTVCHMGLMAIGVGLLSPRAAAGTALYVAGHACAKGAIFLISGIFLHRFGTVDEMELRGKGRWAPIAGVLMVIGALGLAGVPPFGTGFGGEMIDEAAKDAGAEWVKIVFIFGGAVTAGAVLRAAGRIYWNLGASMEATAARAPRIEERRETRGHEGATPWTMWLPAAALLLVGMGISVWPGLQEAALHAAARMQETGNYRAVVLAGAGGGEGALARAALPAVHSSAGGIGTAAITVSLAVALAIAGLTGMLRGRVGRVVGAGIDWLRVLQSGQVGDYVAWLVAGMAAYGGVLLMGR